MKILILEDELVHVSLLKNALLNIYIPTDIMGIVSTINETVEFLNLHKPDVLLLDIGLQNESSFELFHKINYKDYQIIFVTGFDNYAVSAFDVEAIGYLSKPVVAAHLEKFLKIAQKNILQKTEVVKENYKRPNTISIPTETGFEVVALDDIVRFEAINTTTHIFLKEGKKKISSYNIGKFNDRITDKGFYCAHRSHIINLQYVKKYNRAGIILMIDNSEIPLSRNKRAEFVSFFVSKDNVLPPNIENTL